MIVTEEEAKTKWCPESRKLVQIITAKDRNPIDATSANRSSEDGPITSCIGSACMAWQWLDQTIMVPDQTIIRDVIRDPASLGFCGKAGKP